MVKNWVHFVQKVTKDLGRVYGIRWQICAVCMIASGLRLLITYTYSLPVCV